VRRVSRQISDAPPHGWVDVVRQVGFFFFAYMGYQLARGLADGNQAHAIANGQHVINLEKSLGWFFEPQLQHDLIHHDWLIDFANFMYLNSHFVVTTTFLVWLYLRRNDNFYFVRNMFMIAMAIAIVGYTAFPTAPPRMFPLEGFSDTVSAVNNNSGIEKVFVNPFAAVPSMHCGFALMVGATGFTLAKHRAVKVIWALYPALVFGVVVVTANHFWFDGAMGWLTAAFALLGARQLARYRESWSFAPSPSAVADRGTAAEPARA
jgi:hypothetical protein